MVKRVLKDLTVDRLSNNEAIINISIWSDVAYLDKGFLDDLLNPQKEDKVNINPSDGEKIFDDIRAKLSGMCEKYDITPDMGEHDILLASLSEEISKEIVHNCVKVMKPTIKKLVDEVNKVEKGGKTTPKELQDHLGNIIKLIDLMKSHLAYVPTLQQRDKLMFQILDDVKNYAILGEKFTKLENFTTFWRIRESMNPTNTYNVGLTPKAQMPPRPPVIK